MVVENKHNRRKPGPWHIIPIAPCTRVFTLQSDPGLSNLWQTLTLYYTNGGVALCCSETSFVSLPENITSLREDQAQLKSCIRQTESGREALFSWLLN